MKEMILGQFGLSCNGVETSLIACVAGGDGGIWAIILLVLQILTYGVVAAGVLGIVISGIQYMTSAGNPAGMTKAKRRIVEVVAGLACYGLAWTVLNWLIPGGMIRGGDVKSATVVVAETNVGEVVKPTINIEGSDQTYTLVSKNKDIATVVLGGVRCVAEGDAEIEMIAADGTSSTTTVHCDEMKLTTTKTSVDTGKATAQRARGGGNNNDSGGSIEGVGMDVGSIPLEDWADVKCYAGTVDLGIREDAYSSGNKIRARMCAVEGLPSSGEESTPGSQYYVEGANGRAIVASVVSENYAKLVQKAKAAGMSMTASSSWRSNDHQKYLKYCDDCNCCNGGNTAASAGYSNHQSGLAIDFDVPYGNLNITSCASTDDWASVNDRGNWSLSANRWKNSPLSQFFCENLNDVKLKRSTLDEPWHVSPSGG